MRESEGRSPSLYRLSQKECVEMTKKGPIVEDVVNAHVETAEGHEILDNSPVAIPLRFKRVDNITQKVQDLVAKEFSRLAEKQGYETFEEADDFDCGDDYDPRSPYELDQEQEYYDHRAERRANSEKEQVNGDQNEGDGELQSDRKTSKGSEPGDRKNKRTTGGDDRGDTVRKEHKPGKKVKEE